MGELAFQDLIVKMPKGIGGHKHVSMIIDAASRRVSAMALKSKDEALVHCVAYVRTLEKKGQRVKTWRSDNGGEFVNEDYKNFLMKEGIAQDLGAPYTPQSQGLVERANGVFKRLMGKTLRSLGLPMDVWPGLVPGVVRSMNSAVHAVLGQSPLKKAGEVLSDRMPALALGDVVSVVDPHTKRTFEGFYGGQISDHVLSVVARATDGGWRLMRVHPSAAKLIAWPGRAVPQSSSGLQKPEGGEHR